MTTTATKTALITGASAGLGHEFAKLFVKDGHNVILVARRRERLDEIATELRVINGAVHVDVIAADLGVPGAGEALYSKVADLGMQIDFLVNNAGFGTNGAFAKSNLKKEMQLIDLNVRTLVELTHLILPEMIRRKSGRVLNIGSMAGFQPGPYMAAYYASKAFVNSFSEALHDELKGTGVTCTVLAPGATKTEFAQAAGVEKAALFEMNQVASAYDVALHGYRAMMNGEDIAIPGLLNRALVQALRFSPRRMVRKVAARLNQ